MTQSKRQPDPQQAFVAARTRYRLNLAEGKKLRAKLDELRAQREAYLAADGDPAELDMTWEPDLVALIAKVDAYAEQAKAAYAAAAAAAGQPAV